MPPSEEGERRYPLRKRLLFTAIVVLFGMVVCELGARLMLGQVFDLASTQQTFETSGRMRPPLVADMELGWSPARSAAVTTAVEGTIHLDAEGLRIGLPRLASSEPEVLVAGDSITFGDEVRDEDTWAAQLEVRRGRRVLNAGVPAYGLDQAVLRAEQVLRRHRVDWVVLTFIPDDLVRSTHARRFGMPKPVFVPGGDGFVLVPPRLEIGRARLRRALGHSRVVTVLMKALGVRSWQGPGLDDVMAHGDPVGLARHLLDRFVDRVTLAGARPVIVYLDYPDYAPAILQHHPWVDPLLAHLRSQGHAFLDAGSLHAAAVAQDPSLRQRLYRPGWHLSPEGNKWFAGIVDDALRRHANDEQSRGRAGEEAPRQATW